MIKLSAATIIHCDGRVLIGHVTGNTHWDLPKGGIDHGETAIEAAIRECKEEFNVDLNRSEMKYLGQFKYQPSKKKLEMFICELDEELSTDTMYCDSFVNGDPYFPEIDQYMWVDKDKVLKYFGNKMRKCWEDNGFLDLI